MNRIILSICSLVIAIPLVGYAHIPSMVTQADLHDTTAVYDLQSSQAFYAELTGLPHTYEFSVSEPTEVTFGLLIPDSGIATERVSGLLIQQPVPGEQRVTEIAVLPSGGATWESFYEGFGADYYLQGPEYTGTLEAGQYRFEVNTPTNLTKYVLIVGSLERWDGMSYPELVHRLIDVKQFMGKSPFAIFQSPLIYVPLIVLLLGILLVSWLVYRHVHPEDELTSSA